MIIDLNQVQINNWNKKLLKLIELRNLWCQFSYKNHKHLIQKNSFPNNLLAPEGTLISVIQFSLDRTGQYFFIKYDTHITVQYRWQGNLTKRTGVLRTPFTRSSSLKWPSMFLCFCKDIFCSFSLLMFFTALSLCCVVESNEVARFRLSLGEIELKSHLILGSGSRMRSSF